MKLQTRELTRMALYVALFLALDYISAHFLPTMPEGGSLGLSSIVLIIAAFDLGIVKGLLVVILGLLASFITDPPYFMNFTQYFLDYVVGYTAYAFAPALNVDKKFVMATIIPNAIRFLGSFLSGIWFYGADWQYSATYQAWYIIPTILVTIILLPLIYPRLKQALKLK